ncbi:MAG: hypothetical protein JWO53_1369 [Chlamydiia bacterium]|nr:hypothetical protein [Chlamydiia bacterium]
MRAAGISLFEIVAPLLLSSTVIALITFQLVLDLSADAHLKAKELEFHLRSMNPLALMHNSKMLEQGGISVEMNGSLQRDGKTKDFIMAIHRQEKDRMALFIAKEMYIKGNELKGKNLSLISTFTNPVENRYDHLVIENAKENVIPLEDLASAMTIKRLRTGNDELRLPLLIAKKNDLLAQLNKEKPSQSGAKRTRNLLNRCYTEIARRLSLSLAIITFALLGAAFGSTISRTTSRWRFIPVIALTCFFLICFLGAKAVEVRLLPSLILYFLPHIVLIIASVIRFMRIERGVEE